MTPAFRLFFVNGAPNTNVLPGAGKLTLKNLTLRNGLARGGSGSNGCCCCCSASALRRSRCCAPRCRHA
jgi:hypothetical protein